MNSWLDPPERQDDFLTGIHITTERRVQTMGQVEKVML
jgi:hypothetical protein